MNSKSLSKHSDKTAGVLLALALCYVFGIFIGQGVGSLLYTNSPEEMSAYLEKYFQLGYEVNLRAFIVTFFEYVRYPVIALLLGALASGVVLIPLSLTIEGFLLSFAVSVFAVEFSAEGILAAFVLLGIRSLFILPCTFYFSALSFSNAAERAKLLAGGRRVAASKGGGRIRIYLIPFAVLSCGVVMELLFTHKLLAIISPLLTF